MERNTKKPASEWLDIKDTPDDPAALDLELAITYRLQKYDIECQENLAKLIAVEVGKLFGGGDE